MITITINSTIKPLIKENLKSRFWSSMIRYPKDAHIEKFYSDPDIFQKETAEKYHRVFNEGFVKVLNEQLRECYWPDYRIPGIINKVTVDLMPPARQEKFKRPIREFQEKLHEFSPEKRSLARKSSNKIYFYLKEDIKYSSAIAVLGLVYESVQTLTEVFGEDLSLLELFLEGFVPFSFASLDFLEYRENIVLNTFSEDTRFDIDINGSIIENISKPQGNSKRRIMRERTKFLLNTTLALPVLLALILIIIIWDDNRDQLKQNLEFQKYLLDNYEKRMNRIDKMDSILYAEKIRTLQSTIDSTSNK